MTDSLYYQPQPYVFSMQGMHVFEYIGPSLNIEHLQTQHYVNNTTSCVFNDECATPSLPEDVLVKQVQVRRKQWTH